MSPRITALTDTRAITDFDLYLFGEGTLHRAFEKLGAHRGDDQSHHESPPPTVGPPDDQQDQQDGQAFRPHGGANLGGHVQRRGAKPMQPGQDGDVQLHGCLLPDLVRQRGEEIQEDDSATQTRHSTRTLDRKKFNASARVCSWCARTYG